MTEKNLQIIHAATELFLKDGFHGTQMNAIAEQARVSKRTLYKYYKSKEEVYAEVLSRFLEKLQSSYQVEYNADREFLQELERLIRQKITYVLNPEFLRFSKLLLMEQFRGEGHILLIAGEALRIRALFSDWLTRNIRDGKFSTTLPVDVLTNFYHQSIEGMIFWPAVLGLAENLPDTEIDQAVTVIMNSFRHEALVHNPK